MLAAVAKCVIQKEIERSKDKAKKRINRDDDHVSRRIRQAPVGSFIRMTGGGSCNGSCNCSSKSREETMFVVK